MTLAMNWEYLYTFLQSSCLEVPIYFLFYRKQLTLSQTFLVVTLANSVTHPLVFFGFMGSGLSYLTSVMAAESFAVIGETFLLGGATKIQYRTTFIASLTANLFSWQVAPVLTYLFFFGS